MIAWVKNWLAENRRREATRRKEWEDRVRREAPAECVCGHARWSHSYTNVAQDCLVPKCPCSMFIKKGQP